MTCTIEHGRTCWVQIIEYTTIGLHLSRHGAAEVIANLAEELRHAETNPTCEIPRQLLHVTLKFVTKILRSDIFAQENFMSVTPMLQNLRIGLRKRQSAREAAWKLAKSVSNF